MGWRDAGKFQAVINILDTIGVGRMISPALSGDPYPPTRRVSSSMFSHFIQ